MQLERERYVTSVPRTCSLPELIDKFNIEHPGLNVKIPNQQSECIIRTIRTTMENEDGVLIRRDRSQVITDRKTIPMEEIIEIECSSRDRMKKVKEHLGAFLDALELKQSTVITKKTKEEQAMELVEQDRAAR